MPELPEMYTFARDMQKELVGKKIADIEIVQPKSLNVPADVFQSELVGATIRSASYHGKWVQLETTNGWLLMNLGMGGEMMLVTPETMPEKYRLQFSFADGSVLAVNFWWFGYAHWAVELTDHPMVSKLGPNALDLSLEEFRELLRKRRGAIKPFLLNQKNIAGIGNVIVQDPLFQARIHPMRSIADLSDDDIEAIYESIQHTLREAIKHGGSSWEFNLYGQKGSWGKEFFQVAYREDEACPVCGTTIEKIKTGSNSGYICPNCQV
jgi:formamidopyrimidine-DNA glycosylase